MLGRWQSSEKFHSDVNQYLTPQQLQSDIERVLQKETVPREPYFDPTT